MSHMQKSSTELLFEFILQVYNSTDLKDLLSKNEATFLGNCFIWTFLLFDKTEIMPGPDDGEVYIYAIDPFTKVIFRLYDENQDPRTGEIVVDDAVAHQIHLSINTFLDVTKMFENSLASNGPIKKVTKSPSSLLFDIVKAAFDDDRLLNILTAEGGLVKGNYFIWPYKATQHYAINPIKSTVHYLSSQSQKPDQGILITDESEILDLLEDLIGYLSKDIDFNPVSIMEFNPATYKAENSFSKS